MTGRVVTVLLQLCEISAQSDGIGGYANGRIAWQCMQLLCQGHYVPSQCWLSTRQANFIDTSSHEDLGLLFRAHMINERGKAGCSRLQRNHAASLLRLLLL